MKLKQYSLFLSVIFIQFVSFGQKKREHDTTVYQLFKHKKIFYIDYGYNTAPFSLKFEDSLGKKEHLYYRNNLRSVIGLGFAYKWFAIRIAFNPPGHLKSVKKYGTTDYLDVGFEFKTRKHFFDIDLHNYRGYAIKNAYLWNDSLSKNSSPNYIQSQTNAMSISVNAWRFFNKNIAISAIRGKIGMYLKPQNSFYLKTTVNVHGVSNNGALIPLQKQNPHDSQTQASTLSAIDFGVIPGFLHVNKIRHWQFSGMIGFGPIIQLKSYFFNGLSRSLVGVVPRYDFRFSFGYNTPVFFANLIAEFDNKSILFTHLRYIQTFYMIKLVTGIRIGQGSEPRAVKSI